jgi:hypothetical protein
MQPEQTNQQPLPTQTPATPSPNVPVSQGGKNSAATAALILGILGFIPWLGILLVVLALIFGVKGLKKAKILSGKGKGMAITGIIFALFWTPIHLLAFIVPLIN